MALRRLLWILAFATSAAVASPQPKVVDGPQVQVGEWPWMAHLVNASVTASPNDHICGGLHIGNGVMVTARHCIYPEQIRSQLVCVGNVASSNRNNCFPVIDYAVYDGPIGSGDIALVLFGMTPELPAALPFATLASSEQDGSIAADEPLTVIGYGSTTYQDYVPSELLRSKTLPRLSATECEQLHGSPLPDDQICVEQTPQGAAHGDSGGPLFISRDGQMVPVAMVSDGNNYVTRFVRYAPYHAWIAEVVGGWLGESTTTVAALLVPADQTRGQGTVVIHNWSNERQPVTVGALAEGSPFTIDSSGCPEIAPLSSCRLTVAVDLANATALPVLDRVSVTIGDRIDNLELRSTQAEPLAAAAAGLNWSQGTNPDSHWVENGNQLSATVPRLGVAATLIGEAEGPGVLAMTLSSTSNSGDGFFSLMVDGESVWLATGRCQPGSISVELGEGPHRLEWQLLPLLGDSSKPITATITDLNWVDGSLPAVEPSCQWYAANNLVAEDGVDNGSGGGGGSWGLSLLGLAALLGWRRVR